LEKTIFFFRFFAEEMEVQQRRQDLVQRLRRELGHAPPSTEPTWADTHYLDQGGEEASADFSYEPSDESSSEDMSMSEEEEESSEEEQTAGQRADTVVRYLCVSGASFPQQLHQSEEKARPLVKFLYRDPIPATQATPIQLFWEMASRSDQIGALAQEFCDLAPEESDCLCGVHYDPINGCFDSNSSLDGRCGGFLDDDYWDHECGGLGCPECEGTLLCVDCQGWGQKKHWLRLIKDLEGDEDAYCDEECPTYLI
jgi:hypothetical protein